MSYEAAIKAFSYRILVYWVSQFQTVFREVFLLFSQSGQNNRSIYQSTKILKKTRYAYLCIYVHAEQNKLAALSEYDDHSVVCLFNITDSFFLCYVPYFKKILYISMNQTWSDCWYWGIDSSVLWLYLFHSTLLPYFADIQNGHPTILTSCMRRSLNLP